MSPLLNLGRRQKPSLSQVLSSFLSRTPEGKAIIHLFERDREAGSAQIVDYIEERLKDQPEFQRQIEAALGREEGQRFTTLVAEGGHVDQLINAQVVEQLEIRYYLFQDSSQIVTFLLGVVLIGTAIASLYWWSVQPRGMHGRFNIAVAEFVPVGGVDPDVADTVSQQVFRFLDDQANQITFEDVRVSNTNIGQITSAQQARSLAQRINAQVVIYGDVSPVGDHVLLTPQFYVAEAFRADVGELNGQQKLAEPITLPQEGLSPDSDPVKLLQERTVIMTQFTKTLVYLAVDDLPLAREAIRQAIRHGEGQAPFEGQEVLYLFASEIARLQKDPESAQSFVDRALSLNPEYGRGYIAKANIYYDQEKLYQAKEYYEKARVQPDQPFGAYIPEKANLGIGNSCWVQLQYVLQNPEPDPIGSAELEKCAFQHYQEVIDFYKEQKEPETNLKEMAAWAYYGLGTLLREPSQAAEAERMYQEVLRLTSNEELKDRANARLKEVKE